MPFPECILRFINLFTLSLPVHPVTAAKEYSLLCIAERATY